MSITKNKIFPKTIRTTVYPPTGGWFKPLTHLSNE